MGAPQLLQRCANWQFRKEQPGGVLNSTAILYWPYRAELTNDPSLGVNQKMNDSEAACCGAEALGLRLGTTGCATGKQ